MGNPQEDLPKVLNTSMATTVPLFTLVVVAFYLCLDLETMTSTTTLATVSQEA